MVRDALQSSVAALGEKSRIYDKEQSTLTLPLTHSSPDLRPGTPAHLALTFHRGEAADRQGGQGEALLEQSVSGAGRRGDH